MVPTLNVWIVHAGEPIAGIDPGARDHRYGLLSRELARRGHQVVWWNSTFQHLARRHRFHTDKRIEVSRGLVLQLLHCQPGYRRNVALSRWFHHRALAARFTSLVAGAARPDVIVASVPTPELCEAAVGAGRALGVPVVVDVQDPWPDIYLSVVPPIARPAVRGLLAREFRRVAGALGAASGLTAVSDTYLRWGASRAEGRAALPAEVFPLGYDPDVSDPPDEGARPPIAFRTRFGIPDGARLVAFSGSFGQSYDLDTIAACAAEMRRAGRSDIQFVIAGDGDRMERMRRRSDGLPNLTLTGWLDQRSLAELMAHATVGLCRTPGTPRSRCPTRPSSTWRPACRRCRRSAASSRR
ncbi:MAG: glycosyltransferase family 4 protein [Acidimicrobiia bacterium]|nr:glycosyltransferase family 4 protein [Acidimicrobiia bacterium]